MVSIRYLSVGKAVSNSNRCYNSVPNLKGRPHLVVATTSSSLTLQGSVRLCRRLVLLCNRRRGGCKWATQARSRRVLKGWGRVSRRSATGGATRFAPRPISRERGSGRGAYVNTRGSQLALQAARCRATVRPRTTPCRPAPPPECMTIATRTLPRRRRSRCHSRLTRL